MNRKIISIVLAVTALGILAYDYFAGQQIKPWVYVVVALLVAGRLVAIFAKKTSKE